MDPRSPFSTSHPTEALDRARRLGREIVAAVDDVIAGKHEVAEIAVTVLLAGGHLLVEDVPGVGKTTLAKALSAAIGAPMRRIQFTPDLMPSDITGVSVFDPETREFHFRPGAIFSTVVVCDEINRATPRAQSAVLECMEEGQVSVDGRTYALGRPFVVVATQNPLEMAGTYPLPEAQRDRFMARVSMGYPDPDAEVAMLADRSAASTAVAAPAVTKPDEVAAAIVAIEDVHVSAEVRRYVVALLEATRTSPDLRLGASPRAGLHLVRAARARAALDGRDHVLPDDVQALLVPVLAHRVVPAERAGGTTEPGARAVRAAAARVRP
ncbi:AAA family ATPase [Mobilicoccus pelagius]|uniref:Putative regulatory protein n=1 Tax=Mobilicoccus pelagius NBRC 104925 TaxID=1089455 RepID=H5UQH4_9MICO|nr:AAA family ATPase [Mobilicoccus pelagius]GAB47982.1 putative regulatory protein [Mobilicoccus pelagius NBRC 104925]